MILNRGLGWLFTTELQPSLLPSVDSKLEDLPPLGQSKSADTATINLLYFRSKAVKVMTIWQRTRIRVELCGQRHLEKAEIAENFAIIMASGQALYKFSDSECVLKL